MADVPFYELAEWLMADVPFYELAEWLNWLMSDSMPSWLTG